MIGAALPAEASPTSSNQDGIDAGPGSTRCDACDAKGLNDEPCPIDIADARPADGVANPGVDGGGATGKILGAGADAGTTIRSADAVDRAGVSSQDGVKGENGTGASIPDVMPAGVATAGVTTGAGSGCVIEKGAVAGAGGVRPAEAKLDVATGDVAKTGDEIGV